MGSTSSSHSRLISRSNSSIGMGNKRLNVQVEGSSISLSSNDGGSSGNHGGSSNSGGSIANSSSIGGSTGTSNSGGVNRHNSSVRVANQTKVAGGSSGTGEGDRENQELPNCVSCRLDREVGRTEGQGRLP